MDYVVFGTNKITLMIAVMKKTGISPQTAMYNGFGERYIKKVQKYALEHKVVIFLLPIKYIGKLDTQNGEFIPFNGCLEDYGVFVPKEKRTKSINKDDIVWLRTLFKNKKITLEQFLRVT